MFDKNTLIGTGLIAAVVFGWLYYTKPSQEEMAKIKKTQDSLALVETNKRISDSLKTKGADIKLTVKSDSTTIQNPALTAQKDSLSQASEAFTKYRDFSNAIAKDDNTFYTLENNKIKLSIAAKGGRVASVELKEHKRADGSPLILFSPKSTVQSLIFNAYNAIQINTGELNFVSDNSNVTGKKSISVKLLSNDPNKYLEYVYSISDNDYMVDYDVKFHNLEGIISGNVDQIALKWKMDFPSQEKYITKERDAATIYFKYKNESPDKLSERSEEEEKQLNESPIKWISFKQQFFSSILIAKDEFIKDGSNIKNTSDKTELSIVETADADLGIPYKHGKDETFKTQFYFGPNDYFQLKKYEGLDLQDQMYMGFSVFSYINKWLVAPVLSFFKGKALNYGLVILILTLIIKILLFPIAWKTNLSSAKMRVLKPEIDEINKKHEKDDPMKKQQATMALYSKAGASPFSGCLPVIFQMLILVALFNYFPQAFELRGESFLWATDLSTYDSILDFGYVPILNTIYGDHVSLFAILMTITTLIYTVLNQQQMNMAGSTQQMPGMKVMMYIFPIMFLPIMNNYASGLSYYYFLANVINIAQTYLLRWFTDEKKLRLQLEENMKKPAKKQSGFQARLQDMMKQQQAQKNKK
jgi:YidC/Oxa1 family membrane protein insertase